MGIIKTFGEWINESASSVKSLTDRVYQAIIDAGLGDNFHEQPSYNDESSYLTAQADAFGYEITDEVDCIPFDEGSNFDYDKYIFYGIYITDEAPINDRGGTASIIIEYGEDDYTDGPEPWVLLYSVDADHWDGDGPLDGNADDVNPELLKLISVITMAVNPNTKFTPENMNSNNHSNDDNYNLLNDENCSVANLYNYLIDHYKPLGDEKIELEKGNEDGTNWYSVHIPITLSGSNIETEVSAEDPTKIWSIDFTNDLMKYVEDMETVIDIDDEEINDDNYSRAYTNSSYVLCNEVVDFLDEILGMVPDPALSKE